jgi:predicted acyl esterase
MRLVLDALFVLPVLCFSQAAPAPQTPRVDMPFLRETYSKFEYRIPMRDGVRLFTAVYVPKDVFSSGAAYPIMLVRTPYSVRPYGVDQYPSSLGPSVFFAREKFIFAYQDVRGRYMSEGVYTPVRPFNPRKKSPKDIDESSDAYDTIDWLVKNVRGNSGKVGCGASRNRASSPPPR